MDIMNFSMEISDEDRDGFQKTADFMLESDMIEEALDVNTLVFSVKTNKLR